MVERRAVGRHAWVAVLVGGLLLNVAVLVTVIATENPNFVPALILLGSAFVPATFLAFAAGRTPRWEVSGGLLVSVRSQLVAGHWPGCSQHRPRRWSTAVIHHSTPLDGHTRWALLPVEPD